VFDFFFFFFKKVFNMLRIIISSLIFRGGLLAQSYLIVDLEFRYLKGQFPFNLVVGIVEERCCSLFNFFNEL
jgi:hypothetical protein